MRNNIIKRVICFAVAFVMAMSTFSAFAAAQVVEPYFNNKVLGLFWSRVDIGQTNDKWIDVIYENVYTGFHYFQLSDKGTYKVTTEFVVYGSGGPADTITRTTTTQYK